MRVKFKKVISLLLVATLVILTGQVGFVAKAADELGDNVVLYHDFEDGELNGWGTVSWVDDNTATTVVGEVYGTKALKVINRANSSGGPLLSLGGGTDRRQDLSNLLEGQIGG